MKKLILYTLIMFVASFAFGQKEVRKYYDPQKKVIQEIYFVANDDPDRMVGHYQRFYETGHVMVDGSFDDGRKSGVFTEYHENGTPARKITYVNGLRHGRVEVFNEEGKSVQKAY